MLLFTKKKLKHKKGDKNKLTSPTQPRPLPKAPDLMDADKLKSYYKINQI